MRGGERVQPLACAACGGLWRGQQGAARGGDGRAGSSAARGTACAGQPERQRAGRQVTLAARPSARRAPPAPGMVLSRCQAHSPVPAISQRRTRSSVPLAAQPVLDHAPPPQTKGWPRGVRDMHVMHVLGTACHSGSRCRPSARPPSLGPSPGAAGRRAPHRGRGQVALAAPAAQRPAGGGADADQQGRARGHCAAREHRQEPGHTSNG